MPLGQAAYEGGSVDVVDGAFRIDALRSLRLGGRFRCVFADLEFRKLRPVIQRRVQDDHADAVFGFYREFDRYGVRCILLAFSVAARRFDLLQRLPRPLATGYDCADAVFEFNDTADPPASHDVIPHPV